MTQHLRVHAALAEDLGLFPYSHMVSTTIYNSSPRESDALV